MYFVSFLQIYVQNKIILKIPGENPNLNCWSDPLSFAN